LSQKALLELGVIQTEHPRDQIETVMVGRRCSDLPEFIGDGLISLMCTPMLKISLSLDHLRWKRSSLVGQLLSSLVWNSRTA